MSDILSDLDFSSTYCVGCRRDAVDSKGHLVQSQFAITSCAHVLCQTCLFSASAQPHACPKCKTEPLDWVVLDYKLPPSLAPYFKALDASLGDFQNALNYQITNLTKQTRFLKDTCIKQRNLLNQAKADLDAAHAEKQDLLSENERLKAELDNARTNKSRRLSDLQTEEPTGASLKRKLRSSAGCAESYNRGCTVRIDRSSAGFANSPLGSGSRVSLTAAQQQQPSPIRDHVKQFAYPGQTAQSATSPSHSAFEMPPPSGPPHRSGTRYSSRLVDSRAGTPIRPMPMPSCAGPPRSRSVPPQLHSMPQRFPTPRPSTRQHQLRRNSQTRPFQPNFQGSGARPSFAPAAFTPIAQQ